MNDKERADALQRECNRLNALLNTPEILNFSKAVELEAAHQRERWPKEHDEQKTEADWLWLIAYLSTKAFSTPEKDKEKKLHRIVTVAAAACNWHAAALKKQEPIGIFGNPVQVGDVVEFVGNPHTQESFKWAIGIVGVVKEVDGDTVTIEDGGTSAFYNWKI